MIRLPRTVLFFVLFIASSVRAFSFPMFLEAYKADKFTKAANANAVCNFCHMSPQGGDERNPFGKAFEAGGETFTPILRAQFPDRFSYPVAKVNDTMTIHFSDPDNKMVVVESGGKFAVVDVAKKTVDGKEATPPAGGIAAAPAATQPGNRSGGQQNLVPTEQRSAVPVDAYAREGAFFGQSVVDLPNGKPQKKGGVDFWIGHRFPEPVFQHSSADLFGFDSPAIVAFGVRAGLTNRLSVAAERSNYFRTVELSSTFQVSRQEGGVPVTLQVRAAIEGRNDFHNREVNPFADVYQPSIQVVAVRTFYDRWSLLMAPTFAFNTRNEATPAEFQFGADHNNTIALGLGMGIRVLKSTSIVGEYVPRVWGFRGEFKDRPEVGFGVQKATFRHTFQLVFSTAQPMTTARYAVNGTDTFGIGFNIYRKLR
jgi:hypothetical protein